MFYKHAALFRTSQDIFCNGKSVLTQMIPPPPPPMSPDTLEDDEALGSMLMSWYMSGYHTGYYLVQLFLHFKNSDPASKIITFY